LLVQVIDLRNLSQFLLGRQTRVIKDRLDGLASLPFLLLFHCWILELLELLELLLLFKHCPFFLVGFIDFIDLVESLLRSQLRVTVDSLNEFSALPILFCKSLGCFRVEFAWCFRHWDGFLCRRSRFLLL